MSKGSFELPNEVVTVKFIKRKKGMAANVDDNHVISGGMLDTAKRRYCAPVSTRSNQIMNVLTNEEKEVLEEITGVDLSVYKGFWDDFYVSLRKDENSNKFDLSDPMQYIAYKVLLANKNDIAPDWQSRTRKATYDFVITREDEVFKEKKAKYDSKKEAYKLYGKIEDDRDKLISILKLLTNRPISNDSKMAWVQGQVEEFLDTMPSRFLEVVTDPSFETKALINKGVEVGVIVKNSNKYSTVDGLDLCNHGEAPSFDNAVDYLDNPKNQEVRDLIEAKIDNAK